MNTVQLNAEELKGFINHMVKNNQHIQAQGKVPVAVNIEGDAGLGKTSTILQLGKELGMDVVKLWDLLVIYKFHFTTLKLLMFALNT
jgi:DNA helicase TIP49 (TBP-interacting protein)